MRVYLNEMLSSSPKPPPPPPAPPVSEKLKSDDDEIVDLLKCSNDNSHTYPNKFSIRDYVFSARGKDIKTHWPFSLENLQLCLRNGLTEVLPPFETLETVKHPSPFVKRLNECTSYLTSWPNSSKNAGLERSSRDTVDNFKSNSREEEQDEAYFSDVNPVSFQTKSSFLEAKKPTTRFRAIDKARSNNTTQNPGKKCRLIVKLGNNNISEPKSNEWDFSETAMASSNACPVCKTFTSSSNTTLNAHIDQCLTGESKVKRTENPKDVVMKHRIIKPRKARLMVDIYKTALSCTLEDLDRRNGTNWALNLSSPSPDQENNDDKSYPIFSEDKVGAVYIDSNGTKVCILSKLSDMNTNTNGEDDCGARKLLERDKVSKILPSNKKKHLVQRENILQRHPYERRRCSPRPGRSPEEVRFPPEENEKDGSAQPLKATCHELEHDQLKSNGSGLIKQWTGSKRTTGHKKKINSDQKSHNQDKIITMQNSRNKSCQLPSLDDHKPIKKTSELRLPISTSDNINPSPLSASESDKRKESMEQQPCLTNRAGYSLFDSGDFDYGKKTKNNHMMLLHKRTFKRRKENGTSFPNGKEFKKLSPSSKNPMPIRHAAFLESKSCLRSINSLKFKKSSTIRIQNNKVKTRMRKDSDHSSFDHWARVLKIQKCRRGLLNSTTPNHSNASSESDSHGFEHNIDSFVSDNCIQGGMSDSLNAVETRDEFVSDLISKISCGEPRISYDESLAYEEKMLCAKDLVAEVDGYEGEEGNYFVDVDPIPIPGPPGSFLPSPGRMGSEELQGNSTLTSCRVHSAGNEPEWIDRRDSLDSPISGASFVSNSRAFGSHAVPRVVESSNPIVPSMDVPRVVESSNPIAPSMDSPKAKSVFPESRFPIGGDCESRIPSTPNPILRLMGKNLVVNKEEDCVPKIGPLLVEFSMANEFPNGQSCASDAAITAFSRNSSIQNFHFVSNVRMTSPQVCAPHHHQSRSALLDMTSGREGFVSPMDCHGYTIRNGVKLPRHNTLLRNPHSCGGGREGMIIMNDPSINEAGLRGFRTTYAAGNVHVGPRYYDPGLANPFQTGYQTLRSGSQMGQHANNYHMPPGHGMHNQNPVTRIRTPEGGIVSTGHEKSSFYLPTKFI